MTTTITIHGKQHELEVTEPMGAGGGYHIFVDRYYQGCIVMANGVWKMRLIDKAVIGMEWEGVVMGMVGG